MLKVIVPALFLMTTFFGGDLATAKTPKATKKAPAARCATKKKETASCCCAKLNCCADRDCGMGADCCAPGSDCCVDGQCTAGKKAERAAR
jgi:membrane protease subunit (stomatin/prohibitin family)